MDNFVFQNPTKIIFGTGTIARLADEINPDRRILACFGKGSAKRNGVYRQVMDALAGRFVLEFWGIEPNPDYDTAMKAVTLAREKQIDYLLAVGGGSVIDAVKFIAHAIPYRGEPWELVADASRIKATTPFGTVLTTPATGSEMNHRGVLSRRSTLEKVSFISDCSFPQFSVLDPEVTRSLPKKQIANGVVDAFMHVMEQYMTYPNQNLLMDRWSEGVLQTLVEVGPGTLQPDFNYDAMSNFMLCTTMALNGFIGMGVPQDWTAHRIGYELTILYSLDHAETLAVLYPSILRLFRDQKRAKLLQYGERVWGIASGSADERIDAAIEKTEQFFRTMGLKTRLHEYGIPPQAVETIYQRLKKRNVVYGERQNVTPQVAKAIFEGSY